MPDQHVDPARVRGRKGHGRQLFSGTFATPWTAAAALFSALLVIGPPGQGQTATDGVRNSSIRSIDETRGPRDRVGTARSGVEQVLIRASKPYRRVIESIEAQGGKVTHLYRYFDGLAAEIPRFALGAIIDRVGSHRISRDLLFPVPTPVVWRGHEILGVEGKTNDFRFSTQAVRSIPAEELRTFATLNPTVRCQHLHRDPDPAGRNHLRI